MATKPKAILSTHDGREASPITKASNVLFENGQTAQDILNDRQDAMISPVIENSSSMFKVGQGDNVDYSSNVVNGAYESMVLKGKSMVNCIQEPSSEDVVLPYEFEDGQYVTINDTKESGALGVELKGQTLVNLIPEGRQSSFHINNVSGGGYAFWDSPNVNMIKPSTKYLVLTNVTLNTGSKIVINNNEGFISCFADGIYYEPNEVGIKKTILTSKSDLSNCATILRSYTHMVGEAKGTIQVFEYQEGMEHWDIPYFTGMTSIKMPILHTVGKNLFDIGKDTNHCWQGITEFVDGRIKVTSTHNDGVTFHRTYNIPVKKGRTYHVNVNREGNGHWYLWKNGDTTKSLNNPFTVDDTFDSVAIGLYCAIGEGNVCYFKPQIEEGTVATAYEPYKSSILSLPEEVVLRNIGSVKDTLNLNTGDYIQRIGEVVLDGSEDEKWGLHQISSYTTHTRFEFSLRNNDKPLGIVHTELKCDRFAWINGDVETEHIKIDGGNTRSIFIYIQNSKLATQDVNGLRAWLSQNPTIIQYQLETPIVTKINLPSTLKSWNTTTHIYSEIPENTLYPILSHSNPSYPVILKPSTKYSIVANSYSNNHTNSAINFNLGGATASTTVGNRVTTITTPSTLSNELLTISGRGNKLNNVMVIEGDVVGDEPYFEGICDCKSPILSNVGKNLFTTNNMRTGNIAGNGSSIEGNDIGGNWQVTDYIPVKPLIKYYHSTSLYKFEKVSFYDINKKIIYGTGVNNFKTGVISTPHQCAYARYVVMKDSSTNNSLSLEELVSNNDIVVTQGGSNIAYEPYKSNTTTFDQKDGKTIVLRSLPNGVCDTLNVETGEYIQRIGEVTKNNATGFGLSNGGWENKSDVCTFEHFKPEGMKVQLARDKPTLNCDKVPSNTFSTQWNNSKGIESITQHGGGGIVLSITRDKLLIQDVDGLNTYLQSNPLTIQYELATPIVTTIDIQGFPFSYENGHVILSSGSIEQSLTPKVEYSVATNRNGQIRSNQKMVERHQKQLDQLQAIILANLVNSQYNQTLTTLKYELSRV